MQTRFILATLGAFAVLALAAFWQLSAPEELLRARIPDRVKLDDPATVDSAPLDADIETPPPLVLDTPPPAPVIANDPSQGTVWLRVIDADTNRPLADTDCRMLHAGYQGWGDFCYSEDVKPEHGHTDADGLLALSVQVCKEDVHHDHGFQVILDLDANEAVQIRVPVPRGFYALGSSWELGEKLFELHTKPLTTPVDVLVRRLASVRITARDRYGMPIPDAYLRASVLISDYGNSDWVDSFCQNYNREGADSWRDEVDELRREIRRDQVTCTLVGAKPDSEVTDVPWYSEEAAAADQFGTLSFRNLPCTGVGVLAWHPRYGTAAASMNLSSGRNELDVYFREEMSCEVRIRVNWAPIPETLVGLNVELQRTGPQGLVTAIADGESWFSRGWHYAQQGSGTCELLVSGVAPGWWHVCVDDNDSYAGMSVELAPGETRRIDLHLGEASLAQWTPVIRSGGVQLEDGALYLLGGSDTGRAQYSVYYDPDSGETESFELAPGTYTAWLPTLEAFTFTLEPGEKRTDVFELKSLNVNMTFGLDLAKRLGDPDKGARLDLLPVDIWDEAREHLYSLDASMRKLDPDYDLLKPGIVRGWKLPPGEYEWQLYTEEYELSGRITFTDIGPTSLHFGLDTLPGYATLDVTLIGFQQDDPPSLWLNDDSAEYLALRPASTVHATGPSISYPDMFEDELFNDVDVQEVVVSETRVVFFAPAGTMHLRVSNYDDDREYIVTLPSRITVQANEIGRHGLRKLNILDSPEDPDAPPVRPEDVSYDDYDIELSAPGWFERAYFPDRCDVPHGAFQVRVVRVRFFDSGGYAAEYAEFDFAKGTDDLVVELWKLDYKPCATLDLEFKGRGSPEQPVDAWWFYEDGPRAPHLYALDDAGKNPRLVSLTIPTEYMPGGRLEFAIRGKTLTPGKYRLVPWPDAPAKYVREFTLQSGRHTTITVQGG